MTERHDGGGDRDGYDDWLEKHAQLGEGGFSVSLAKVWVVKDPSNNSTLEDIFWEQDVVHLARYILGSPEGSWIEENHAICTTREEAEREARERFARLAERFAQAASSPSPKNGRTL